MSQTEAEQRLSQEIQFFDFMFTVLEIVQKLFAMTSSNKTEKQCIYLEVYTFMCQLTSIGIYYI